MIKCPCRQLAVKIARVAVAVYNIFDLIFTFHFLSLFQLLLIPCLLNRKKGGSSRENQDQAKTSEMLAHRYIV